MLYEYVKILYHHSLVNESRAVVGELRLSDWMNRPGIIQAAGNFDNFLRGLITQPQQEQDVFYTDEVWISRVFVNASAKYLASIRLFTSADYKFSIQIRSPIWIRFTQRGHKSRPRFRNTAVLVYETVMRLTSCQSIWRLEGCNGRWGMKFYSKKKKTWGITRRRYSAENCSAFSRLRKCPRCWLLGRWLDGKPYTRDANWSVVTLRYCGSILPV